MAVFLCTICDLYIYDEEAGDPAAAVEPDTRFDDIEEFWQCPICRAPKDAFVRLEGDDATRAKQKYGAFLAKRKAAAGDKLDLVTVRDQAREKMAGICGVYPVCDGRSDRLCQGQHYGQSIGLGGAGRGLAFEANTEALNRIRLKPRLISPHAEPDLSHTIFGREIALPAMPSPVSGVRPSMGGSMSEMDFAIAVLQGAKDAGLIGWIGNTADEGNELTGIKAIEKVGLGIPMMKPQKNERLLEIIKMAEDAGAAAVGVDVDGVGSTIWDRLGKPVFRKSIDDLHLLASSTDLPFIAKGIMTVEDAEAAVEAGVSAIDVSNHGGRSLDSTRGVADVLPEIVNAVGGKATITTGGGVRTGFDVLKMLALGADAVLVGRDTIRAALGGGAEGVKLHFDYLRSDLRRGMVLTSCNTIADVGPQIIDNA